MAPAATTTDAENTKYADGRQGKRIENYAAFWQKDLSKEQNDDTQNRLMNYVDVINGELAHFFCRQGDRGMLVARIALGWCCTSVISEVTERAQRQHQYFRGAAGGCGYGEHSAGNAQHSLAIHEHVFAFEAVIGAHTFPPIHSRVIIYTEPAC